MKKYSHQSYNLIKPNARWDFFVIKTLTRMKCLQKQLSYVILLQSWTESRYDCIVGPVWASWIAHFLCEFDIMSLMPWFDQVSLLNSCEMTMNNAFPRQKFLADILNSCQPFWRISRAAAPGFDVVIKPCMLIRHCTSEICTTYAVALT